MFSTLFQSVYSKLSFMQPSNIKTPWEYGTSSIDIAQSILSQMQLGGHGSEIFQVYLGCSHFLLRFWSPQNNILICNIAISNSIIRVLLQSLRAFSSPICFHSGRSSFWKTERNFETQIFTSNQVSLLCIVQFSVIFPLSYISHQIPLKGDWVPSFWDCIYWLVLYHWTIELNELISCVWYVLLATKIVGRKKWKGINGT